MVLRRDGNLKSSPAAGSILRREVEQIGLTDRSPRIPGSGKPSLINDDQKPPHAYNVHCLAIERLDGVPGGGVAEG